MHIWQIEAIVLSILLALAGGGPIVDAAETGAAQESDVAEISSCTVIEEPGHYVLTRDLAPTSGIEYQSVQFGAASGCLIVAQNFDGEFVVDGNGHTISGANVEERTDDGRAVGAGIVVDETPSTTVSDLTVTGWETGVDSRGLITVDGVTATENGAGLFLDFAPEAVTNSVVSKNDGAGIVAAGNSLGQSPTVVDLVIEGNVVEKNGETGVSVSNALGGRIADNDISNNDGTGLSVRESQDLTVTENRVSKNGGHGAEFGGRFFANEVLATHNFFEKNGESGVHVDGDFGVEIHENHFEKNGVGVSSTTFDRGEPRDSDLLPIPLYEEYVNATGNYWGAENGPASVADADAPFADPVTGRVACGDGDAVTEGSTPGVSAVRFDPYLTEAPPTAADGDDAESER